MSKDLLKQIGIIGISFGLVASPLTFAQNATQNSMESNQPPAAQSTDSAADPMDKMDGSSGSVEDNAAAGYGPNADKMSPEAEATNSQANPMEKASSGGGSVEGNAASGYGPNADEMSPEAEATNSQADPMAK